MSDDKKLVVHATAFDIRSGILSLFAPPRRVRLLMPQWFNRERELLQDRTGVPLALATADDVP